LKVLFPFFDRIKIEVEGDTVSDKYNIGEEIGRGGFSVVKKATNKDTHEEFAIKIIAKNQSEDEISVLKREIEIMTKLKHKNIIYLHEVFEDNANMYLVLELVTGGELFDHIISRNSFSENDAAAIIRQALEAVDFMHKNDVAHRDLKPENILVTGPNCDIIKVSDFGLSKDFGKEKLVTSCGTPDYVAPEVLRGGDYGSEVDVWSIGVICYILLCGYPPFYGEDHQIFEKILKVEYDFPKPDWDTISEDAKEFIQALLKLDPQERPTAEQCLESPWITSNAPTTQLAQLSSFKTEMTGYNEKRKKTRNNVFELPRLGNN